MDISKLPMTFLLEIEKQVLSNSIQDYITSSFSASICPFFLPSTVFPISLVDNVM